MQIEPLFSSVVCQNKTLITGKRRFNFYKDTMDEIRHKEYQCKKCGRQGIVDFVRNITASGISQVFMQCRYCKENAQGGAHYISHQLLKNHFIVIEDLKVINDYRSLENACVVCGELGSELHHFAPHYLFGDRANYWPTGFLCRFHHMQWHSLVTPDMTKRNSRDKV